MSNGKEKIWYLSYQKKPWRRSKTKQSYRDMPVHSSLVSDVLKFIKGRKGFIFEESDQNKYKSRSAAISKRMATLIDRIDPAPEVREHSFRHTVVTKMAESGVLEELRKAVVGHAGGVAHDGYNHARRIRQLSEDAIELLDYKIRG